MDIQMFMDLYELWEASSLSLDEVAELIVDKPRRKCTIVFPYA